MMGLDCFVSSSATWVIYPEYPKVLKVSVADKDTV